MMPYFVTYRMWLWAYGWDVLARERVGEGAALSVQFAPWRKKKTA
jgi:hypothetical protein